MQVQTPSVTWYHLEYINIYWRGYNHPLTLRLLVCPFVGCFITFVFPELLDIQLVNNFGTTVCKMVHPILSDCCLSVTLVYYGKTVGWIQMKLGMQVGLGPGNTMLDGDPTPPPKQGHRPPIFGPCLLRPNGWVDQDATWHGSRPRPRQHCVRWGTQLPPKRGTASTFRHVCCGQTPGWIKMALGTEVGLGRGNIVLDVDPAPPKKAQPPIFGLCPLWPNGSTN